MSMSLQDFVRDTLAGIVLAVEEAQQKVGTEKAALIAPQILRIGQGSQIQESDVRVIYAQDKYGEAVSVKANLVRFDLAVHAGATVEVAGEVSASANVGFISSVKARLTGRGTTEDKRISRIQFEIPVIASPPTYTWLVKDAMLDDAPPSRSA